MSRIEIYTKNFCPYCARAKALLDEMELDYSEYELTFDPATEAEMNVRSGRYTVPQIFVDGVSIGGSDELVDMVESGEFCNLLNQSLTNVNHNQEVSSHV